MALKAACLVRFTRSARAEHYQRSSTDEKQWVHSPDDTDDPEKRHRSASDDPELTPRMTLMALIVVLMAPKHGGDRYHLSLLARVAPSSCSLNPALGASTPPLTLPQRGNQE